MNEFLKSVLATVVGIFVFPMIMGLFLLIGIIGFALGGSSSDKPKIDKNSVLVVNLTGMISEQSGEDILGQLTGNFANSTGMDELLLAIKNAKESDKVKGIYLEGGLVEADKAQLQELRNALEDFKKSGKWIVAYADTYEQGAYYLASVANKVWLNPKGMLDWHGLAMQTEYYKGLYDKLGIHYQILKVGKFKSYTEAYTEEKMSDANREQSQKLVDGTWKNILSAVSKSRKISADSLNAYANGLVMFADQQILKQKGLVDGFLYHDQVSAEVRKLLKIDADDDINQVSVADMAASKADDKGEEIAVYYAEGSIVSTAIQGLTGGSFIASDQVCSDLKDLADDDDVKAVVLRINSGGGDAFASEQLWRAVSQLKKKKPVVVSMGGVTASGAYYTSVAANWLVADPNTITGSIGIFAAIPEFSELATKKLGLKFDAVKTNTHSDFGNVFARPFDASELSAIQGYVNRGYVLFRKRVADGRRMSVNKVESIAQGRVWLAPDALKLGLIDQLGGINDAIAKAAKLAKVNEYHTVGYPAEPGLLDQLLGSVNRQSLLDEQLHTLLGDFYPEFVSLRSAQNTPMLQARIPYGMSIK